MTSNALVGFLMAAAVIFASGAAYADEDASPPVEGPPLPRVQLSVEGPEEAVLEERTGRFDDRESGWRQLCSMPCQTVATADPYAQHRIVDDGKTRFVTLRPHGGERLVLHYERAPASASLLVGGGIAVAALGVVLAAGGLTVLASNTGPSYEQLTFCNGDTACESRWHQADSDADAKRGPGRTLLAAGGVTALVGGIAIFVGALLKDTSAPVVRRAPALAARF